ncbi:hypothetical protein ES703_61522 [subsurface metagenome]
MQFASRGERFQGATSSSGNRFHPVSRKFPYTSTVSHTIVECKQVIKYEINERLNRILYFRQVKELALAI